MEQEGSDPERMRGMWTVPSLWNPSNSIPSDVKNGISQRMCEPLNKSALPLNGALGVRRRFCLDFPCGVVALSNIDTKLGLNSKQIAVNLSKYYKSQMSYGCWLFHWSPADTESSESGVALRDREPVLELSASRKTSLMSGFRGCLDLVRPRTVLFNAFTRCFTASAWFDGSPATLDFSSKAVSSRP